VITQDPMMIRSCGLSSTFKAMPVLRLPFDAGHHSVELKSDAIAFEPYARWRFLFRNPFRLWLTVGKRNGRGTAGVAVRMRCHGGVIGAYCPILQRFLRAASSAAGLRVVRYRFMLF
jgi:hypothetical protein